jgi:hypothetical protein
MTKKKRARKEARKASSTQPNSKDKPVTGIHAPDFNKQEYYYVIGTGDPKEDVESVAWYYIEHDKGFDVIPLFSTPEKAERYIELPLQHPSAYVGVLESIGTSNPKVLESYQDDKYFVAPLDREGVAKLMVLLETTTIVLDAEVGKENPTLRLG